MKLAGCRFHDFHNFVSSRLEKVRCHLCCSLAIQSSRQAKSQMRVLIQSSAMSNSRVRTYGDLNALIGQDESGVGAGELSVRHVDGWVLTWVED